MLNLRRYMINIRYLSISKSNLIESSQNIENILKSINENNSILKWFSLSINEIHREYPSIKIATSTKNIYQKNSSKLNSNFIQLENNRKNQIEFFQDQQLIILLRYIRYLQVAFIYRQITYDIHQTLQETSQSIINQTKDQNNFNQNSSLSLICELNFFVKYLSSNNSLSQVKSLLSKTFIVNYLLENLFRILSEEKNSILLVEEICSTLYSIIEIPLSIDLWPLKILNYLYKNKSCSLSILEYLILIQHNSIHQNSSEFISILNQYLIEHGIYQYDLEILCQLLILIASSNYSHQLFHQEVLEKIENYLKNSQEKDRKLYCRLIYYLCLNDPTNRFHSRSIIVELSKLISGNFDFPQWIVQAQHGMMCVNIYNYQLLFSMIQQKFFPTLFRNLGVYSSTIYRQLFDIHYALTIDRPTLQTRLLNQEMLSFATKISNEYRSSIRSTQKSYNRFLNQLKDLFNHIYGNETCQIINYPYFIFDFLELNLPDKDELKAIGINTKQRIGILPILNSMLIRQQRSNGSLVRVLSAHTTMRYRMIENNNYQVIPIFHGEYIRAIKNNTMKTFFETNLALKSIPHQIDQF